MVTHRHRKTKKFPYTLTTLLDAVCKVKEKQFHLKVSDYKNAQSGHCKACVNCKYGWFTFKETFNNKVSTDLMKRGKYAVSYTHLDVYKRQPYFRALFVCKHF